MALHDAAKTGHGLDWIDRTICGYLVFPLLLFCFWFITPVTVALLALTCFGTYSALRKSGHAASVISSKWLIAILLLSLGWVAIAGVGHFFYANVDWVVRDAVLHDLTLSDWPPTYSSGTDELLLRAPIGYYLPSATIGSLLGINAAQFGLYAWTVLGWALFVAAALSMFKTGRQRAICIVVLMLFGGLDYLGYIWMNRHPPGLYEHIEWWMPFQQYSSNTTLLAWVPNHALPAWLGTLLILRHWHKPELARITPLLATAIPLWSPLSAIGLIPFFLFGLAWRRDLKALLSLQSSLPFTPLFLLTAAYLGMDSTSIPHGWLLNFSGAFAYCYALFCLIEFGLLALILARLTSFDLPLRIAAIVLCTLPLFYYGMANDLMMRASIPALTVFALGSIKPLAETKHTPWHVMLWLVIVGGMWSGIREPARALASPNWQPLDNTIPAAVLAQGHEEPDPFPKHYFAHPDAHWLQHLLRKQPPIQTPADTSP